MCSSVFLAGGRVDSKAHVLLAGGDGFANRSLPRVRWYAIVVARAVKPSFSGWAVRRSPTPELRGKCVSREYSRTSPQTDGLWTTVPMAY